MAYFTHTHKKSKVFITFRRASLHANEHRTQASFHSKAAAAPPCLLVNSSTTSLAKRVTRSTPQQNCKPLCVNALGNGQNRKCLFNLQIPIMWCDYTRSVQQIPCSGGEDPEEEAIERRHSRKPQLF